MVGTVWEPSGFAGAWSRDTQLCLVGLVGVRQAFPKDVMLEKGPEQRQEAEKSERGLVGKDRDGRHGLTRGPGLC